MNSIEELLTKINKSKRPITAKEIELLVDGKSNRNKYKELQHLIKIGVLIKVKFDCYGYRINKKYKLKKNGIITKRCEEVVYQPIP